jgi:hypothetical protein
MIKIEKILKSILGLIICVIGLGIWCIDYLIFTAIGALTAWIAGDIGMTGMAVFGLQVIGWIVTLGTMIQIFICGLMVFWCGLYIIMRD